MEIGARSAAAAGPARHARRQRCCYSTAAAAGPARHARRQRRCYSTSAARAAACPRASAPTPSAHARLCTVRLLPRSPSRLPSPLPSPLPLPLPLPLPRAAAARAASLRPRRAARARRRRRRRRRRSAARSTADRRSLEGAAAGQRWQCPGCAPGRGRPPMAGERAARWWRAAPERAPVRDAGRALPSAAADAPRLPAAGPQASRTARAMNAVHPRCAAGSVASASAGASASESASGSPAAPT